ncbi:hypothetical protein CTAYLR_004180 [Chrysophaeum taylorii]|uniref:Mitochondrial processing peptidase alpha subunit n=1 Tax=Chrysophaeum taylorii TaxID=2483200 RepID=A0AAD7UIH7_9STRA|nr:hypothetical protein CTAYLR_004180 [Chrysophaeum taylorii]
MRRLSASSFSSSSWRWYSVPREFAILPPFPGVVIPPKSPQVTKPFPVVTKLESGLRVVSQETFTHMSAVGIVVEAGGAYEVEHLKTRGCANLGEVLAWCGTHLRDQQKLLSDVDGMGGYLHANAQREQTLYCVDALRERKEDATRLLAESVLMPMIDESNVEAARRLTKLKFDEAPLDAKCKELVHAAAYGPQSPLGSSVTAPCAGVSASSLLNYRAAFFTPDRAVVAGTGIEHSELVDLAKRFFEPHLPPPSGLPLSYDSTYHGGLVGVVDSSKKKDAVRVAVALEVGGWHDRDLVTTSVLQTLLGGGDSFSAGGPGKGMYSRLYREVLNYVPACDAAEAFASIHRNTGLLGISGAAKPEWAGQIALLFAKQLRRLATEPVKHDELNRAKNMLKGNALSQLESRLCLFEDLARQFSTFGKRQNLHDMAAAIDNVTQDDILRLAKRMCSKPPAVAAIGPDLSRLPSHDYFASLIY